MKKNKLLIFILINLNLPGTSSKYLKMGKLDLKAAACFGGEFLVPRYSLGTEALRRGELSYPVIVKPSRGCGSLFTTQKSVCRNFQEVEAQVDQDI